MGRCRQMEADRLVVGAGCVACGGECRGHNALARDALRTLAANLAVGGALWAAHTGIDDTDGGGKWWPGLGKPAPEWER